MPRYAFLGHAGRLKASRRHQEHLKTLQIVGVPYTDEQIDERRRPIWRPRPIPTRDTAGAAGPLSEGSRRAISTATRQGLTEMDALVAYLQMLGTLVDFTKYQPADLKQ